MLPFLKLFRATAFLLLLALQACSTEEIMPSDIEGGQDYYPIQTGNAWTYRVDTVRYSSRYVSALNSIVVDTFQGQYFQKEIIADSLGLQEGNPFFRIEIYRSTDSSGPWLIDSVWSIQRSSGKILKTENNRPLVKLKFPLLEGSRWDGNQYNSLQDSTGSFWYKASKLGKNKEFQNNFYPAVVIVQRSDSNCLGKADFSETYLKGPEVARGSGY